MSKWRVVLSRVEYQTTTVEVDADTAEEAEETAIEEAGDWETVNAEESALSIEEMVNGG